MAAETADNSQTAKNFGHLSVIKDFAGAGEDMARHDGGAPSQHFEKLFDLAPTCASAKASPRLAKMWRDMMVARSRTRHWSSTGIRASAARSGW